MTHPSLHEEPLLFACGTDTLVGVLARPDGDACADTGVVVIVGGPQYRAGSHRQFVHLARHLAHAGFPVLRFDYRGMGDSGGAMRLFSDVDDDIEAAVSALLQRCPGLRRVVLWGLCDGASAAAFYAWRDGRVAGLVLANPWVRTAATHAQTYLRHYYLRRLTEPAFWKKLARGGLDWRASAASAWKLLRAARADRAGSPGGEAQSLRALPLPLRFAQSLERFDGQVLLLISGDDYTAAEFTQAAAGPSWRRALAPGRTVTVDLPGVDHTFSSAAWRQQAAEASRLWLSALPADEIKQAA